MAINDPFSVLEIAPTMSLAQVKRAYFLQLQKHPPHSDPDGFRQLRAAYESLVAPGALGLAYVTAPFDIAAELDAWRFRWEAPIRQAAERFKQDSLNSQAVDAFVAAVSSLSFDDAAAKFG
jgi:hypothetical protein